MSEETARQSVDFMLKESGANKAHVTFFGGETLLFSVLKGDRLRTGAAPSSAKRSTSACTNGTLLAGHHQFSPTSASA
jgi:sulfatase maturation enzyme AslB (radical SAM superfamily)